MANRLEELAVKHAAYEALRNALMHQGQKVVGCACWHHDAHGLTQMQGTLTYMQALAGRMGETLADIHRLEEALLAP